MASNIVFTAEKTEIGERESFSIRRTGWDTWDTSLPWDSLSDCIMTLTNAFAAAQGTTTRGLVYQVRNIAGGYRPKSKLQWLNTDGQEYLLSIYYDELPLLASALTDLAAESGQALDLDFSKLTRIKPGNRFDHQLSDAVKDEETELSKAVVAAANLSVQDLRDLVTEGRLSEEGLNEVFAPVTFMVESFVMPEDTSDDLAWQRAVNAARTFAQASVVQGGARRYEFSAIVNCHSLNNVTVRGFGSRTVLASKSGELGSLFNVPTTATGVVTNLVFEDMHVDGGMIPMAAGFARDERVFNAAHVSIPFYINGNLAPTGASWSTVNGVSFKRVSIFGCKDLPILVRGASEVIFDDLDLERTMDLGSIFCDGVTLVNSRSRWSADNGFSISRGNKNAVIVGNRIFGCHRWGLWVGGWDTDAGPTDVVCTGNQIMMAGYGGITLQWGTSKTVIANNTIRDCRRGAYGNAAAVGVGIQVYGLEGTVPTWSEDVSITGNLIVDAQRGGILVRSRVRNITVESNTVIRPGTENDAAGVAVPEGSTFENFGVSVPSQGTEVADGKWGPVTVRGNTCIDDRTTPWMNFGTITSGDLRGSLVLLTGNRTIGARSVASEPNLTTYDGVNSTPRGSEWRSSGALRAAIRMSSASGVSFFSYSDAGTEYEVAIIDRAAHQLTMKRPVKLASYATGSRPSAVTYAGSLIYDSTIGKVIFSNGSLWSVPVTIPSSTTSNPDTSGATLTELESEVNELKALLRTLGVIAP